LNNKKKYFIILFLSLIYHLFFNFNTIYSQYSGGDFVISNSDKQVTTDEVIVELTKIVKLLYISGYKIRQVDCLKNSKTKKETFLVLEKFKEIVPLLPENYSILVIGHADQIGREYSFRGNKGNDYYSTLRAKSVSDFLSKRFPVIKNILLIGGAGSKKNERMVTFQIKLTKDAKKIYSKLLKKYNNLGD